MTEETKTYNLLQLLTLGVVEAIDSKVGVFSVKHDPCSPADRHAVLSWEQRNSCLLPEDLKSFYLTNDGLQVTWTVKVDDGPFQLGKMWINPISQLCRLGGSTGSVSAVAPSLADLEPESDSEEDMTGRMKPRFDNSCRVYELDPCDGYGKVCLAYTNCKPGELDLKPEIWFLDRSLQWHYLSETFTSYYRLMLMHQGLPQWQYSLTDIGLSAQAKQWFNMYAPLRLELDHEIHLPLDVQPSHPSNSKAQIDVAKVFKGKTDRKKQGGSAPMAQNQKKKPSIPGNKTPTGGTKYGPSSTPGFTKSQK